MPQMNKKMRLLETHGEGVARAYDSWVSFRLRLRHPDRNPRDSAIYGRIDMDPRWDNFEVFLEDMGERPRGKTLDRIDGQRGYWPDNSRWATPVTQSRNRDYVKLNSDAVREIRARYAAGGVSQQAIADDYNVSQVLIGKVIRRENWADL